jgi:hypothetical protein
MVTHSPPVCISVIKTIMNNIKTTTLIFAFQMGQILPLEKQQFLFLLFRWVKFEEDVEEGGNRWSKPYVATLSLHSLFELRSMLLNGTICLDMQANTLEDICDGFLDTMSNTNQVML